MTDLQIEFEDCRDRKLQTQGQLFFKHCFKSLLTILKAVHNFLHRLYLHCLPLCRLCDLQLRFCIVLLPFLYILGHYTSPFTMAEPSHRRSISVVVPPVRNSNVPAYGEGSRLMDPFGSDPPSSPLISLQSISLVDIDDCWNEEQKEYIKANGKGGGLDLIVVAKMFEEKDEKVPNTRSALLQPSTLGETQLSLLLLGMDRHLIDAIIMGALSRKIKLEQIRELPKT